MSSQHGPYTLGYTHVTMRINNELSEPAKVSQSLKHSLSGDRSLQFDYVNADLVVIAKQLVAVNTFLPLAHTARQANKVAFN